MSRENKHAALLVLFGLLLVWGPSSAQGEGDSVRGQLATAVGEVALFNFKKGYELSRAVLEETVAPSPEWQQATFLAAVCAQQVSPPTRAMIEEAGRLYRLLLEKTPDSKYAPRTMMNLGRIEELSDYYEDEVDLAAARHWYEKVVEGWPDRPVAGEATLRIAATHIQTYDDEQVRTGAALLETWLAAHPDDPLASAMWQYLGDTYFFPLASYRQSLECYARADGIGFLEKGREGPVYWRMAAMADRHLADREEAVKYYTRIIERTPTSGKAYEAQLALARLGAPVPEIRIFQTRGKTASQEPPADRSEEAPR